MAKFSGKVGFGASVETSPGVWTDEITERSYFGDVVRNHRMTSDGENQNEVIRVNTAISIVADAYASGHFFAIRYVEWAGERWTVPTVEVHHPRLVLQIGEKYNGITP